MEASKRSTNYVILRKRGDLWEQFTAQYARNAEAAITNVVTVTGEAGTYIAVPARSWRTHIWPKVDGWDDGTWDQEC